MRISAVWARAPFSRGLTSAPTSSRSRRMATRISSERAGLAFALARAARPRRSWRRYRQRRAERRSAADHALGGVRSMMSDELAKPSVKATLTFSGCRAISLATPPSRQPPRIVAVLARQYRRRDDRSAVGLARVEPRGHPLVGAGHSHRQSVGRQGFLDGNARYNAPCVRPACLQISRDPDAIDAAACGTGRPPPERARPVCATCSLELSRCRALAAQ